MDSTGLSTDSLYDAGFPGALRLGDVVCGMAAVRITPKDMLSGSGLILLLKLDGVVQSMNLLILRNAFKDLRPQIKVPMSYTQSSLTSNRGMQELEAVTSEMLTGLSVDKAIGRHLLTLLEDSSVEIVKKMLLLALQGKEEKNIQFEIKTHGLRSEAGPISLVVNACANRDLHEMLWGFLSVSCSERELASYELQQALHVQRLTEQTAMKRLKALAYLKKQIHNPLSGIIFSSKMMEGTELGLEQKRLLQTSTLCQRQLRKILDDSDLHTIIDGYVDLEMMEFTLHEPKVGTTHERRHPVFKGSRQVHFIVTVELAAAKVRIPEPDGYDNGACIVKGNLVKF
ncbi:Phytochrome A [Hibiscus syriacus]|uniref:Phytochrome A n=1 Tax=Hibiscus syriacus TaxID=106335 RepID=A0A6A2YYY5_HIBSY|nr:Phytochrome A [Hibiscus syriacus]